jgi:hypothetical protein
MNERNFKMKYLIIIMLLFSVCIAQERSEPSIPYLNKAELDSVNHRIDSLRQLDTLDTNKVKK